MDEQAYRHMVDETFRRIDDAFADVDPDLAESSIAQGALTITFAGGVRCILSAQPPVRQVWVAFRDRAWHLDWDAPAGRWVDDRGTGLDLLTLVRDIVKDGAGVEIALSP